MKTFGGHLRPSLPPVAEMPLEIREPDGLGQRIVVPMYEPSKARLSIEAPLRPALPRPRLTPTGWYGLALGLAMLALLLAGCAPSPAGTQPEVAPTTMHWEETLPGHFTRPTVHRLHDDERGVTCWVRASGGISCLADAPCGASL